MSIFVQRSGLLNAGDPPITWESILYASLNGVDPAWVADFEGEVGGQYFANGNANKSFADLLTLTRTDDAGYWDVAGVFQMAGTDVKRLDHFPDTHERRGLLREFETTNIVDRSKDPSSSPWFGVGLSFNTNVIISPDGNMTGDEVRETTSTGTHRFYVDVKGLTATAWTATFRIYPVNHTWYLLRLDVNGNFKGAYVNLTGAGSIGQIDAGYTARVYPLGNGWWDCEITRTVATTADHFPGVHMAEADGDDNFTGNVNDGLNFARGNLTNDKIGSSIINQPATTDITRNADKDKAVVSGSLPHDDYGQGEGTMAGTFTLKTTDNGEQVLMAYTKVSPANRIELFAVSDTLRARVIDAGSEVAIINMGPITDDVEFTAAVSYIDNALRGSLNQANVVVDLSTFTVPDVDGLYLGSRDSAATAGAAVLWTKKVMYYAEAFLGTELREAGGLGVAPKNLVAQKWRIVMDAPQSGQYVGLYEVQFRTEIGGADETGSGTASAHSTFPNPTWDVDHLFEGISEGWVTEGNNWPTWVEYDFGTDIEITEFCLTGGTSALERGPKNIQLEGLFLGNWISVSDDDHGSWSSGEQTCYTVDQPYWLGPSMWAAQLEVYTIMGAVPNEITVQQYEVYVITGAVSNEITVQEFEVYAIVDI
jgi:hypothetical protein